MSLSSSTQPKSGKYTYLSLSMSLVLNFLLRAPGVASGNTTRMGVWNVDRSSNQIFRTCVWLSNLCYTKVEHKDINNH